MSTFKDLNDAREYFREERFATENGMEIDELSEDSCTCSVILQDHHRNALHGVMGGTIFTLADFAFAVSANHDHHPTVAQNVNISFLNGSNGTKLFAKSTRIKSGRTSSVWQIDVTDDLGKHIALFTGTGFKLS